MPNAMFTVGGKWTQILATVSGKITNYIRILVGDRGDY